METRDRAHDVYEVIQDYFSEPLTDLQETDYGYDVLIRFPEVRVTNEHGRYVDIKELYVKVPITKEGKLYAKFSMLRTDYTLDEWVSNYVHSHCNFNSNSYNIFGECCLGTGPLVGTTNRLYERCDLDIWGLFCFELSKYVTIESLEGIPYRRLENIGSRDNATTALTLTDYYVTCESKGLSNGTWVRFYRDFLKHNPFRIAFIDNQYCLGEPVISFWLRLSNWYIKWMNEEIKRNPIIAANRNYIMDQTTTEYIIDGSKAYSRAGWETTNHYRRHQGDFLFNFKGEEKRLNIAVGNNDNNYVRLLVFTIVNTFISKSLLIINYNYGNKEQASAGKRRVYV